MILGNFIIVVRNWSYLCVHVEKMRILEVVKRHTTRMLQAWNSNSGLFDVKFHILKITSTFCFSNGWISCMRPLPLKTAWLARFQKQMGTASALGNKQDNTQREKSELTKKDMYVISLHMIYVP